MIKKILFFLMFPLCFHCCLDISEYQDLKININTSLPLGVLNISDSMLFSLTSGSVDIEYDSRNVVNFVDTLPLDVIKDEDIANMLLIPDQDIVISHDFGDILPELNKPIEISEQTKKLILNFDNGEITGVVVKELLLSGGDLIINNSGGINSKSLIFTFPNIRKDGASLTIPKGVTRISLSGWTIYPDSESKIILNYSGEISLTSLEKEPNFNVEMIKVKVKEGEGFFGRQEIDQPLQSINIDQESMNFFENIDNYYLSNPSIHINVESNIEIPFLVVIEKILINKEEVELKDEYKKNRFYISNGMKDNIELNNSSFVVTSALSNAIVKGITDISVKIKLIVNPENIEIGNDDIVVSKKNKFNVENSVLTDFFLKIPIEGYFENIKIDESFEMSLIEDSNESLYDIKNISLAILADNTLPLDIDIALYSIVKNDTIPLSNELFKINYGATIDDIDVGIVTLDEKATKRFLDSKTTILKIRASSKNIENKETVSFYKNSHLNLNMVMGVKGNINL